MSNRAIIILLLFAIVVCNLILVSAYIDFYLYFFFFLLMFGFGHCIDNEATLLLYQLVPFHYPSKNVSSGLIITSLGSIGKILVLNYISLIIYMELYDDYTIVQNKWLYFPFILCFATCSTFYLFSYKHLKLSNTNVVLMNYYVE